MVYITPLPNSSTTKQQPAGKAASSADDQQVDQQKAPKQRRRPAAAAAAQAAAPVSKLKQRTVDKGDKGDTQALLVAQQAALATQVLQRVHALQQHGSPQHTQQAGQPAACGGQACQSPTRQLMAPQQPPHVRAPSQVLHPAAASVPSLQLQPQHQQTLRQQPVVQPLLQSEPEHMQEQVLQQQPVHAAKRSQNHMFWDVAPRTINPAEVPGLLDSVAGAASAPLTESLLDEQQQQQQQHVWGQAPWQVPPQHAQQQAPVQHRQQQERVLPGQTRQAKQTKQPRQRLAVVGPPQRGMPAAAAAVDDDADMSQWPSALGTAPVEYSGVQGLQLQTDQQAHCSQSSAVHGATGTCDSAGSVLQQLPPQALQPQQQQHQHHQQQQTQQQTPATHAERIAQVTEALKAAQQHADPLARQHMVKDLKQQLYKLELEQQIAEQEAAKRARKAAAAAQEVADAAARAAAPLPWDPDARASRRGGGGDPLKGVDGVVVADLRNQRHMLPVPGLDVCGSQASLSAAGLTTHQPAPQQQQPQQLQHVGSCGSSPGAMGAPAMLLKTQSCNAHSPTSVGYTSAAGAASSPTASATPAASAGAARGGFLRSLSELRAGPSEQQRAAAAAARQQLQRDLEAQMAEKAARAAALAAAEAARAAAEDASLQQYLLAKSSSQADVCAVGKEASIVYAAAGPLNVPAAPVAAAAAVLSSHGGVEVQRKGRSKRVIDAPWLDQLKPIQPTTSPQEQHLQLQQELSQLHLQSHHVQPQQCNQHLAADSSGRNAAGGGYPQAAGSRDALPTARQGLWQETSSFKLGPSALPAASLPPVNSSLSGAQLATALQQLQQQQLRMWDDFKQQSQELQQLLTDKQAVAADRDAARAELGRVQELLQQQKQLQEAYARQQQTLLDLQQQQQQQQQQHYSTLHVSPRALQQEPAASGGDLELQDCLDAFVVETQLVPISVNHISADTVAVSDLSGLQPPSSEGVGELPGGQTQPPAARNHKSRYSSFYGLDSELSAASVASQTHSSSKVTQGRKARTRVSGSFKPGGLVAAAAAAAATAHGGASVRSSLAASSSFVPFMHLGVEQQQQLGSTQQQSVASEVQARPVKGASPRRRQQDAAAVGSAAGSATAAAGRLASHNRGPSSPDRQRKQSGSPNAARSQRSPGRAQQHACADRGWAR